MPTRLDSCPSHLGTENAFTCPHPCHHDRWWSLDTSQDKETDSIEPASSESSTTDGSISNESTAKSPPQTWVAIPSDSRAIYYKLLAIAFRKKYLRAIKRVYKEGKFRIPNSESMTGVRNFETFEAWLAPVAAKEWVVNAKATPNDPKDQNAVLGYIANYISGTAIFDGRIKKDDGSHVTIRFKDYRNDCKSTETMLGTEFVRRFLLHIVPRGVNRVRYGGIFYSGKRMQRLDLCRQLIQSESGPIPESKPSSLMTPQLLSGSSGYESKCSSCGALHTRSKGFQNRWNTQQSISTLQHLIAIYTICYTTLDGVVEQIVGSPKNKYEGGRLRTDGPSQIWFEDWAANTRYNSRHSQVYINHFINPIGDFSESGADPCSAPSTATTSNPELLPLPN